VPGPFERGSGPDAVSDRSARLRAVLEEARTAGFLGPGPVAAHLEHAEGFAQVAQAALRREPSSFADLGTGGGVPGLWLALRWSAARGVLVESGHRRSVALRVAVAELALDDRIEVLEERAEGVGASGSRRESFDVVTARGFATPAVTAEIATGLVRVGGVLVVSEPPDPDESRWSPEGLAGLGFAPAEPAEAGKAHFVAVRKVTAAPERYPRTTGRPAKRPLW